MDIYEELAQAMAQSLSPLAAAALLRSRLESLIITAQRAAISMEAVTYAGGNRQLMLDACASLREELEKWE